MRSTLLTVSALLPVLASVAAPARAQEARRLTLEQALEAFGEHSLALRIARAERETARGEARQSRAYANPSFTYTREDLDRQGGEYRESIVGLEQRFEWPGRTAARAREAAGRIEVAEAEFRADSLRLAFEVRRAYAEAWEAEEAETAIARSAGTIRRAAAVAERRYGEGDISGYALRRLRVERAAVERALATARLEAAAARRTLAGLVLPGEAIAEVGPAEPLAGRPPDVAREAAVAAAADGPGLRAAERAVDATEARLSASSQAWIPDPTVRAGYKEQDDGFSGLALAFDVPLPLFDRKGGAAAAAEGRHAAAVARLDLRRRQARNDVLAALDRYEAWREMLEATGEALAEDAEGLLESARVAYEEGELELVGLLDAGRAFRDARVSAVELRARTWIAWFDLLRAMGGGPAEAPLENDSSRTDSSGPAGPDSQEEGRDR